jgi:hypothetical protein
MMGAPARPTCSLPGMNPGREAVLFTQVYSDRRSTSHSAPFSRICGIWEQFPQDFRAILRILANSRIMGGAAGLDQLVTLWDSKRTLMRDARRNQGAGQIADLQLTLNQRVQGSSPWALTTTTCGGWR